MNNLLRQSTAVTVPMGPFVDDSDGKTLENALTIQKANVKLSKNGATRAAANADQGTSDAGAAYDADGDYKISLNVTDTNTLGALRVSIVKAGALPVWRDFMVVPAEVYDALVLGSDKLTVEMDQTADGESIQAAIALMRAAILGKASGGGTTSVVFQNKAGTKARVTMTVDPDGNRSAIVTDAT